jgi:hypothetical protein
MNNIEEIQKEAPKQDRLINKVTCDASSIDRAVSEIEQLLAPVSPETNTLKETLKKEYHRAYRGILTDEFIDRSWEWTYGLFEPYMSHKSETPCDIKKAIIEFADYYGADPLAVQQYLSQLT